MVFDVLGYIAPAAGFVSLLYFWYQTYDFIYTFIRPSSLYRYRHAEDKSWALVTGASDGIGLGFVQELLERQFNVVLHGRNANKLAGIKQDLLQQYPSRSIEIVVADASKLDVDFDAIAKQLEALPGKLTVLINNVGGQTTNPQWALLEETPQATADRLINVNVRFPTQLTRALLPLLQKNSPALILNLGSASAISGLPYLTVYSGSKAFNMIFSAALKAEIRAHGHDVEVLGLLVGNTISAGNTAHMPFITVSARELAKGGLDRVGCGKAVVWAHWRHALSFLPLSLIPEGVGEGIGITEMKKRRQIELDALKKQ